MLRSKKIPFKILSIIAPTVAYSARFMDWESKAPLTLTDVIVWAVVSDSKGHRLTSFSHSGGDDDFELPDDEKEHFHGWDKGEAGEDSSIEEGGAADPAQAQAMDALAKVLAKALFALNSVPKFKVGDSDSYAIAAECTKAIFNAQINGIGVGR